jgi:hypothetical protein
MGYNEMDQVWDKSQATRTDKLVLLAIARTYNVGKGSWPSQKTLARVCGINVRSVRRSIQALQDSGELVWVRGSNYSGKANLYYITVCEGAKMSAIVQPEMSAESAEMSAETNKNVRLLNKQLNKLDKKEELSVFDSSFGGLLMMRSCDRVAGVLAPLQVWELLQAFDVSHACVSAFNDKIRLERWWGFLDKAAKGKE